MSAVIQEPILNFRPMIESDIDAVMAIENAVYEFPWTRVIFQDCLRVGYSSWVLEEDGDIVAYGVVSVAVGESHILNLCVHKNFQNNGYVNLGQPFDPSLISKIYSRYKELIDEDNYSCISDAYDGKTYSKRVINAHKNIPEARALLNEKIINFIEQYYKTHFKVIHLYFPGSISP